MRHETHKTNQNPRMSNIKELIWLQKHIIISQEECGSEVLLNENDAEMPTTTSPTSTINCMAHADQGKGGKSPALSQVLPQFLLWDPGQITSLRVSDS